ncbi:MAG: hypothetical protein IPL18_15040 [Sphingomonadales bacterium]|nr:hypothetical protein [Sphingomonadales bacterium]
MPTITLPPALAAVCGFGAGRIGPAELPVGDDPAAPKHRLNQIPSAARGYINDSAAATD